MLHPYHNVCAGTIIIPVPCFPQVTWSSERLGYFPGVCLGFKPDALTLELLPLLLLLLLLILLLESIVNNLLLESSIIIGGKASDKVRPEK